MEKRSKPQTDKIGLYFLGHEAPAEIQQAWRQVGETREQLNKFEETIPTVMVMEEMKVPRESHLLIRGAYDQPGEKVSPGVPSVLPPLPEGVPDNRLGLAKWLVDPANPLTARVTVNRFWAMYFGTGGGLVKIVGLARRKVAVAPRAAGLAGNGICSNRLGHEGHAKAHRDQRHLPAIVAI